MCVCIRGRGIGHTFFIFFNDFHLTLVVKVVGVRGGGWGGGCLAIKRTMRVPWFTGLEDSCSINAPLYGELCLVVVWL